MEYSNYKVIEIMNEKELIINYGSSDGANVGDDIRIYSLGEEVIDPETKTILGTLDIIKDDLEVALVYDNFSICKKVNRIDYNPVLNPLSNFSRTKIEIIDLNVDKSQITGRKSSSGNLPIKVGDNVLILK